MKKLQTIFFAIILFAVTFPQYVAANGAPKDAIVGEWQKVAQAKAPDFEFHEDYDRIFRFYSDGVFHLMNKRHSVIAEGKYSVNGSKIVITLPNDNITGHIQISGDQLVLYTDDIHLKFNRVR